MYLSKTTYNISLESALRKAKKQCALTHYPEPENIYLYYGWTVSHSRITDS